MNVFYMLGYAYGWVTTKLTRLFGGRKTQP